MNFLSVQLLLEILILIVQVGGKSTLLTQHVGKCREIDLQQDALESLIKPHMLQTTQCYVLILYFVLTKM